MKRLPILKNLLIFTGLISLLSCGPTAEKKAKQQKMHDDSLATAKKDAEQAATLLKKRRDSIASVYLKIKAMVDSGSINDIKYYLKSANGFVWTAMNNTGCNSELIFSESTMEFKMDCSDPQIKVDQVYNYKFGLNPSIEGQEVGCRSCRWISIYHWDQYKMDEDGWTRGKCSIDENGHIIMDYNGESYDFSPMSVVLPTKYQ